MSLPAAGACSNTCSSPSTRCASAPCASAELLQLLERCRRLGGVLCAVEDQVGDEFRTERVRAEAAEAYAGIAERTRDPCAEPRLVAAFHLEAVHVGGLGEASFLRGPCHLRALDRTREDDAGARLLRPAPGKHELQVRARFRQRF